MNFSIICPKTFHELVKKEDLKVYTGIDLGISTSKSHYDDLYCWFIYFTTLDGQPFMYNKIEKIIMAKSPLKLDKLTFETWKIEKISDQTPYIKNEYMKGSDGGITDITPSYGGEKYLKGEYRAIDSIYGKTYDFSIMEDVWWDGVSADNYVCYPERINYKLGSHKMKVMDIFYKILMSQLPHELKLVSFCKSSG